MILRLKIESNSLKVFFESACSYDKELREFARESVDLKSYSILHGLGSSETGLKQYVCSGMVLRYSLVNQTQFRLTSDLSSDR